MKAAHLAFAILMEGNDKTRAIRRETSSIMFGIASHMGGSVLVLVEACVQAIMNRLFEECRINSCICVCVCMWTLWLRS